MQERTRHPNIVFIMADQLAAGFIGCYGSGVDSTPTLDRLAAEGVRFTRAYAHSPVCAPNRATIFTGRSIEMHGIVTNNLQLGSEMPTYPMVLQRQGYRTGGFGKFHQTSMQLPLPSSFDYLGFDESVPTEDPRLGPWLDWIRREHPDFYGPALSTCWGMPYMAWYGPDKRDLRADWEAAQAEFMAPRRAASGWHLMYTHPLPAELNQAAFITDQGLDFMERHLRDHSDQPFLCYLSYVNPHDPYDPPEPYDTMFDPGEMPDPIPIEWQGIRVFEHHRDNFHNFGEIHAQPDKMRKLRALYHGSIRLIDDQIARIVQFLKERGLADNSIVCFTTDHGDMMGDHGLITKGAMHYDKSVRVPLIVWGTGIAHGLVSDRLTSSLDMFPTLCEWGGAELLPPHEGQSLAGAASGSTSDEAWEEVTMQVAPTRSIITQEGWRLSIFGGEDRAQMFDLRNDPDEQHDLYDDPTFVVQQRSLHERLTRAYMRSLDVWRYDRLPIYEGRRVYASPSLAGPLRLAYPYTGEVGEFGDV